MSYNRSYFTQLAQIGKSFGSAASVASTGSGNYPLITLWNPIGSGKNIYVYNSVGSLSTNGIIQATLINVAPSGSLAGIGNRLTGGPVGVGIVYVNTGAKSGATTYYSGALQFYSYELYDGGDIQVLTPGNGLQMTADVTAAITLYANFAWSEE